MCVCAFETIEKKRKNVTNFVHFFVVIDSILTRSSSLIVASVAHTLPFKSFGKIKTSTKVMNECVSRACVCACVCLSSGRFFNSSHVYRYVFDSKRACAALLSVYHTRAAEYCCIL